MVQTGLSNTAFVSMPLHASSWVHPGSAVGQLVRSRKAVLRSEPGRGRRSSCKVRCMDKRPHPGEELEGSNPPFPPPAGAAVVAEDVSKGSSPLSGADRTRAALSSQQPLVKFHRNVETRTEQDVAFTYTSGTTPGKIDVWLISTLLVFIVPVVILAVGIGSGYIDVSPR